RKTTLWIPTLSILYLPTLKTKNQTQSCLRQQMLISWKISTQFSTKLPLSEFHSSHRRIFLLFSENAVLTSSEELVLCTGLAAKIDATIHSNFSNHTNKEDGMLIWKSINNYFASTQLANCAQAWNNFSLLNYDHLDINRFITFTCAAIEKMHEVGINIDTDV
ncbi:hypothetical protein VP01_10248g1, partial [Puccinia sorghi]